MDNMRPNDSDVSQQQPPAAAATAAAKAASVTPVAKFPSLIKTDHPNRT